MLIYYFKLLIYVYAIFVHILYICIINIYISIVIEILYINSSIASSLMNDILCYKFCILIDGTNNGSSRYVVEICDYLNLFNYKIFI